MWEPCQPAASRGRASGQVGAAAAGRLPAPLSRIAEAAGAVP